MEKLAFLIIVIVVLFFVINLMADYFISVKEKASLQTCKNSVYAHASLKYKDLDFSEDIKCAPISKEIPYKNEKEIMGAVAQNMANCWDMFGEGELELFDMEPNQDINYCHLCYYMTFKDKNEKIPIKDFMNFLNTKRMISGETYLQYLRGYGTSEEVVDYQKLVEMEKENAIEIDTSKDYGIYLVYNKKKYTSQTWNIVRGVGYGFIAAGAIALMPFTGGVSSAVAITAGGMVIGGVVGSETSDDSKDWNAFTVLYPHNEETIQRLDCNKLPVVGEK